MISDRGLQQLGLAARAARLYGPAIRGLSIVAALGLGTFQLVIYARIAQATVTVRDLADFDVFYRSSERAARQEDPYEVAPQAAGGITWTANLNPPHSIVLLGGLTWFSKPAAFTIWVVASLASAVWAVALIFRELRIRVTAGSVSWTMLVLLCAAPTGALLFSAQIAWLLWGPVTFVWAAARRGHWTAAAVTLGVLASIKPFLGLLVLAFALTQRRMPAIVAAATTSVCFIAGIVALGWTTFASWWRAVRSVTWAGHIFNVSLYGFFDRLFTRESPVWELSPLTEFPAIAWPAWFAGGAVVLGATFWGTRRHDAIEIDRTFAATLSAAFLVSPLCWVYYLFFAAGPFLAMVRRGAWWSSRWRTAVSLMATIGLALGPATLTAGQPSGLATLTIGSTYFWSVLALWSCARTVPEVSARRGTRPRQGS
jgi:hypothetical protein